MAAADDADAYQRLEEAIQTVAQIEGAKGVMTEWIVVSAHQRFDEDGDQLVQVGQWIPRNQVPYHRLLGLLDYALTRMRAEVTRDDD